MRKYVFLFTLSIAGTVLNIIVGRFTVWANIPLFLDTIFTVTVTLLAGPLWGSLTGALFNIIYNVIYVEGWQWHLFAICSIATALITYLFIRLFPRELTLGKSHNAGLRKTEIYIPSQRWRRVIDRMIVLILLSFALCLGMSILGGLISAFILRDATLIVSEIMIRIPINIIDRLITVFCAWGAALLLARIRKGF